MSAKWSAQSFKNSVDDGDVLLIIDNEAVTVDNKQVLASTLATFAQTPWRAAVNGADFALTNLNSAQLNQFADFNETAGDPGPPAADVGRLYVDDDGGGITTLFFQDSASNITNLLEGGSPLTTKGDIITYDTADIRLAVGADGQVLTSDSAEASGVKWEDASGGVVIVSTGDEFLDSGGAFMPFTLANGSSAGVESSSHEIFIDDITITNLGFWIPDNNDFNGTIDLKLRINGADSGLVCRIGGNGTGVEGFYTATGGPVTITAGDLVNWSITEITATAGEVNLFNFSYN